MEVRPGYKQTEVGVIPEEWGVQKLRSELDRLEAGVSVNSVDETYRIYAHEQSILKTSAVTNGRFLPIEAKKIAPRDIPRAQVNPRADTIIVSRMNTPDLVGECGYVERDFPDPFLPDRLWMTRVRQGSEICVKWLAYLLSSEEYKRKLKGVATGTSGSMKNLSKDAVLSLPIPFPDSNEQRAIAAALSDVDALLAKLDALIAKKRDLKQGAMQQLLTGQTRLPGFSGEWEGKRLGEVAVPRKERIDPRKARVQAFCIELEHIEQGSGRLLGSSSTGQDSSLKSVFRAGDVLFGKLRAYLRKYWLAGREGVCSTEIWPLVTNRSRVCPEFLFQLVMTDGFIEAASSAYGTHMPRSDWNVMKNYEVPLPNLGEQTAIAAVLSDMDTETAALETRRDKTRALKLGMMQELLTGSIRLV